jgi:hypothetical protein
VRKNVTTSMRGISVSMYLQMTPEQRAAHDELRRLAGMSTDVTIPAADWDRLFMAIPSTLLFHDEKVAKQTEVYRGNGVYENKFTHFMYGYPGVIFRRG